MDGPSVFGVNPDDDTGVTDKMNVLDPNLPEARRRENMEKSGYPDLHAHIAALEKAGLLIRVKRPINKDSEMHPLVRWQFRGGIPESERKAFLLKT